MKNNEKKEGTTATVGVTESDGTKLYYEQTAENGDIYITVNAGRGSTVNIMSGKPSEPPRPPGT